MSKSSPESPSSSSEESSSKESADAIVAKRRAANYLSGGGIVLVNNDAGNSNASSLFSGGSQARGGANEDVLSASATTARNQSSIAQDMNKAPSGTSLMSVGSPPLQLWVPVVPMGMGMGVSMGMYSSGVDMGMDNLAQLTAMGMHPSAMSMGHLAPMMPMWMPTAQPQPQLEHSLITTAWLQQAAMMAAAHQASVLLGRPLRAPPIPVSPLGPASSELTDRQLLAANKSQLDQCGWYYGRLTNAQAMDLLKATAAGTFLVRDSSDARFAFSLSVQRGGEEGPTSVRIAFRDGAFLMDAAADMAASMPEFASVIDLVQYYMRASAREADAESCSTTSSSSYRHVWMEDSGKLSSRICMRKPLLRAVPSLGHLTRLAINGRLAAATGRDDHDSHSQRAEGGLHLPAKLEAYLKEYPHGI